jgi:hypothetical protein
MIFLDADKIKAALQFAIEYGPGKEEGCQEILDALGDTGRVCVLSNTELCVFANWARANGVFEVEEILDAEITHRKGGGNG